MSARNGFVGVWRASGGGGEARWRVCGADAGAIAFADGEPPPASFSGPEELLAQLRRRQHAGALAVCSPTLYIDEDGTAVAVSARILRAGIGAGYQRRALDRGIVAEHHPAAPADGTRFEVTFGDGYARIDHWQRFPLLDPFDLHGRSGDARAAAIGWLRVSYRIGSDARASAWCASSYLPTSWFYRDWVRAWRHDVRDASADEVEHVLAPVRDVPAGTTWAVLDTGSGCVHAVGEIDSAEDDVAPVVRGRHSGPWALAVLDHFRRDAVVSLGRLKAPTHLVVRAVYLGAESETAIVSYELIDAPPPPSTVAWGGSFEASLFEEPRAEEEEPAWFPFEPGIDIALHVDRLREHVRTQLEVVARRGAPPLVAEEPLRESPTARGSAPAASAPVAAAPAPEPTTVARFAPPAGQRRQSIPPPPLPPEPPPPPETPRLPAQPPFDPRKRISPLPARSPAAAAMAPLPPPPPIPFGLGAGPGHERSSGPPPPEPPPPPPGVFGVPSSQRAPAPPHAPVPPRRASQPPPPHETDT
jgi:hypothetical protein